MKYLYRAVDKHGKTVDFLLTARRDASAARRFFDKAMRHNEAPERVAMDQSGVNKALLDQLNMEREIMIKIRQVTYLNNIVEQAHRAVKCVTQPMRGARSSRSAQAVLAGIACKHMIRKGKLIMGGCDGMSFDQFLCGSRTGLSIVKRLCGSQQRIIFSVLVRQNLMTGHLQYIALNLTAPYLRN